MNFHPHFLLQAGAIASLLAAVLPEASAQVYYPKRGQFDESTGYMESQVSGDWYRGSAVVARDSRLIYSCGHLFYDRGVWATRYLFYRNYHAEALPKLSTGVAPRGFRYFTAYSSAVESNGANSARAFANDFTIFYGNNSFGPAVGYWAQGAAAVKSARLKQIVGYPSVIDYTRQNGHHYQHGTDWFPMRAAQVRNDYYFFNKASTGSGNSGGPLFVANDGTDDYSLAGILVSGSEDTAGIYALNDAANSMAASALGIEKIARTFRNRNSVKLPDGGTTYVTRQAQVSGFSENITGLKFTMSLNTKRRGDLDVYLRSPSGRIRWIHKNSSNTSSNLNIDKANYTSTFRGYAANGAWKLKMRDVKKGKVATFNHFGVTISAPSE